MSDETRVCRVCGTDRFCQECAFVGTDADLRRERDAARAELEKRNAEIERLRRAYEGRLAIIESLENYVSSLLTTIDEDRAELERNAAEVMRLQDELASARAELERARGLLEYVASLACRKTSLANKWGLGLTAIRRFLDARPTREAPTLDARTIEACAREAENHFDRPAALAARIRALAGPTPTLHELAEKAGPLPTTGLAAAQTPVCGTCQGEGVVFPSELVPGQPVIGENLQPCPTCSPGTAVCATCGGAKLIIWNDRMDSGKKFARFSPCPTCSPAKPESGR